jgi:hypothetical protein
VLVSDCKQVQAQVPAPVAAECIDWRTAAAASVTIVLWASAFVAIRSGGRYFDPGALALGRLAAGSVVKRAAPRLQWLSSTRRRG